jgi:hypothetical protein
MELRHSIRDFWQGRGDFGLDLEDIGAEKRETVALGIGCGRG